MWLIAVRDLQFRRRRFVIAVAATALVFGTALLLDGATHSMKNEVTRIVGLFDADRFVVARRATGPFTTAVAIPDDVASDLAVAGGRADPFIVSRATIDAGGLVDVNLVGYRPGGLGMPPVDEGRAVRRAGEAVVSSSLDLGLGDRVRVGDRRLRVVGRSDGIRFNFGLASVFATLRDAQAVVFGGEPLAMGIALRGAELTALPPGTKAVTNAVAESDLRRTLKSGVDTVDFIDILLWLVAAGIVGSIVYLTALERTRDFAVLKATGSSNRSIIGGLAFQAIVLSISAAVVAVGIAFALKPGFPFPVELEASSVVRLVVVAILVGLLASLAGLRRAVSADPALAFGGA